jgi:hypothetical protein
VPRHPDLEGLGWEEITAVLVDPEVGLCAHSARFTHADVVEHICAVSAGRLDLAEITAVADRFLASDLAVRLTPDDQPGRRKAPQWSTAAHRAARTAPWPSPTPWPPEPSPPSAPRRWQRRAGPGFRSDRGDRDAGRGGPGAAVCAGPGRLRQDDHAAYRGPGRHGGGRPVVAVATTAKAGAELAGAGLDARTIARLRIDLAGGPLAAGTIVVLDEISQTPTAEVEAVLAAVVACGGGSVWILGDPRQSQPVGAGGMADHIQTLAASKRIPSARLTVNRRQVDPADRHALDLLRRGHVARSQQLRAEQGWEKTTTARATPARPWPSQSR